MKTQWVVSLAASMLVACGGKAGGSSARIDADASGASPGGRGGRDASASTGGQEPSPSTGGVVWGTGGVAAGGAATTAPDANTACDFAHYACGGLDSHVDIQGDGDPLRLSYPSDAGCGTCAGGTCELWSYAIENCGVIGVVLSVCAGPNGAPPCLDTTSSSSRSYTDRTGKTWNMVSLGGSSAQPGAIGWDAPSGAAIDLDLTLTVSDGVTTRELPVHVHTCGDIRISLRACSH